MDIKNNLKNKDTDFWKEQIANIEFAISNLKLKLKAYKKALKLSTKETNKKRR